MFIDHRFLYLWESRHLVDGWNFEGGHISSYIPHCTNSSGYNGVQFGNVLFCLCLNGSSCVSNSCAVRRVMVTKLRDTIKLLRIELAEKEAEIQGMKAGSELSPPGSGAVHAVGNVFLAIIGVPQ